MNELKVCKITINLKIHVYFGHTDIKKSCKCNPNISYKYRSESDNFCLLLKSLPVITKSNGSVKQSVLTIQDTQLEVKLGFTV